MAISKLSFIPDSLNFLQASNFMEKPCAVCVYYKISCYFISELFTTHTFCSCRTIYILILLWNFHSCVSCKMQWCRRPHHILYIKILFCNDYLNAQFCNRCNRHFWFDQLEFFSRISASNAQGISTSLMNPVLLF